MQHWANNPSEWATNTAEWSNATGVNGNTGWANQDGGSSMPCATGCNCAELQHAYLVCVAGYNAAIASPSGTAPNAMTGGAYTAAQYLAWLHSLQNIMAAMSGCKVPQVSLNNAPSPSPSPTAISGAHAVASGGTITGKSGVSFKRMAGDPVGTYTGSGDLPATTNLHPIKKPIPTKNRKSFFSWLFGK